MSGPFAWNGLMSWWLGVMVVFGTFTMTVQYTLLAAIKKQEAEAAGSDDIAGVRTRPAVAPTSARQRSLGRAI